MDRAVAAMAKRSGLTVPAEEEPWNTSRRLRRGPAEGPLNAVGFFFQRQIPRPGADFDPG